MPLGSNVETAVRYQKEAERLRQEAQTMKNDAIRRQLLGIAASYDGLAETVLILARQRRILPD